MSIDEYEFYGNLWMLLVLIGGSFLAAVGKVVLDRWGRRTWRRAAEELDFTEGVNSEGGQPMLSGTRDERFVEVNHNSWVLCPHAPVLQFRIELWDFWDDLYIESKIEGSHPPVTPIESGDKQLDEMFRIEALQQSAIDRKFPTDKISPLLSKAALNSEKLQIADGELQVERRVHFITPDDYKELVDWLVIFAAHLDAIARDDLHDIPSPVSGNLPRPVLRRVASLLKWPLPFLLAAALVTGGWYFGFAGSLGAPCETPIECRSRLCLDETIERGSDTTTYGYCTTGCAGDHDCTDELACRNVGVDDSYCMRPDLLRRNSEGYAAGKLCRSNSQCYSQVCIPKDDIEDHAHDDFSDASALGIQLSSGICAEPCQSDSDCRRGFKCEWSACIPVE
jgi:hypothetical protein